MPRSPWLIRNDPSRAGQRASRRALFFGPHKRFAVYAVHTRFEAVQWFVSDAETPDLETGLPASIVGQFDKASDALKRARELADEAEAAMPQEAW